jgi:hypothetical protein
MRPYSTLLTLAAATLSLAATASAQETPTQSEPAAVTPPPPSSAVVNPARGSTMDSVRAKFGAPSQEVPAVGKPPITRWEYPGYVVFFEHDRVLHTVVVRG